MSAILKYLLANIKDKKIRTVLVLFSIAISSALLFATLGMSNTCKKMFMDQIVRWSGDADVIVEVKDQIGTSVFIEKAQMEAIRNNIEYSVGILKSEGLYNPGIENMQYLNIVGTSLEDLETYNTFSLLKEGDLGSFSGNKIIVPAAFAQKANLEIGDVIDIKFAQNTISFTIQGIAAQKGIFLNDSMGVNAVVPKEVMESLYGIHDKYNEIFIKLKDKGRLDSDVMLLSDSLDQCDVKRAVNPSSLDQAVNTVVRPIQISSLSVIFMSVFIIFTSFNLMTMERMAAIGTFRSIGATKKKLKFIFCLESMIWGVCGGIIGCFLGYLALRTVVVDYVAKLSTSTALTVIVKPAEIIITIIFAVVLTVLSALPPLSKAFYKSTKSIILGIEEHKKTAKGFSSIKFIILVLIFLLSILIPHLMAPSILSMIVTIICMVIIWLTVLLMIPYGIRLLSVLAGKRNVNNTIWLAVRNVAESRSMLNIIRLMMISVSSILIIASISNSVSNTITSVYDTYHLYDISMSHRYADVSFSERLNNIDGVEAFANDYEIDNIKIESLDYHLNTLYGIEDEDFFQFMGSEQTEESEAAIKNLNSAKYIVLTELLRSKLNLKIGDEIAIEFNNRIETYKITGFVDSSFKLGNIGFVSAENLRNDNGNHYYTKTYIKTNKEAETVCNSIKSEFLEDVLFIQTLSELVEINQDLIVSIFRIINAYAILAVLIGIIGIANNVLVSYIERRRELSMYRTIGMSKNIMRNLFLTESILIGISGLVWAFAASLGILKIIPYMLQMIFGNVEMNYNAGLYIIFAVCGIAVMCIISILPIIKSSKLSIIENIKYE